jgi:uncharacterized repeat protein (TIGR04076 family)
MNPEKGDRVRATVKCIKGTCNAGHKVGDVMDVSARSTAGMCGYLYHAAHPAILMLQFGGNVPWGASDTVELQCPDTLNLLTLELQRVREAAPVAGAPGEESAEGPLRFGRVVCKVEEQAD